MWRTTLRYSITYINCVNSYEFYLSRFEAGMLAKFYCILLILTPSLETPKLRVAGTMPLLGVSISEVKTMHFFHVWKSERG